MTDAQLLALHERREQQLARTLQDRVLSRDNYQCQGCGTGGENRLQLHHVVYRSQQGGDEEDNLVTLCQWCHRAVHAGLLEVALIAQPDGRLAAFCRRRTYWTTLNHPNPTTPP